MLGHEDTRAASLGLRALFAETLNFAGLINLVKLEDVKFHSLVFTLDLLRLGVGLLLAFLTPSTKAEHEVKGGLLLDVVVRKCATILKLFPSEDKTLLIRGDALLVLDLSLDILNCVRWLDIQGDGLSSESFDKICMIISVSY